MMTKTENPTRNSEGYMDTTAYEAIKATDRIPQRGDIWLTEFGKEVLVIQKGRTHNVILTLFPDTGYNRIGINSTTLMYANPMMLSYMYHTNFAKYIKTVDGDEFEDILTSVADALNLQKTVKLEHKEPQVVPQDDRAKELNATVYNQRVAIARYQAERDVYKNLYLDMVKGLTGGQNL